MCLLLLALLLLAPEAARATVHNNYCFQGTCTIQNPVVTNVYWDSSLAQWDQDVAKTPDLAHKHIDDLLLALVHSDYFKALGEFNVNTPALGTSIATAPCPAAPNNTGAAVSSISALTTCLFQYYPQLNSDNTILNVFLPPSVAPSSGWCGNNGNEEGEHDKYGTPIAITILSTNSACTVNNSLSGLSALFYSLTHELVEAATDPNPKSPTGWKTGDGKEIGDLCQPPVASFRSANFLYGAVTPYYTNTYNGCVYGWSSTPITVNGSVCGTGRNMTFTLTGSFGGTPWDLVSNQFAGDTLYLNAVVQRRSVTWEGGNFEGLPNLGFNQPFDKSYFRHPLQWSPGKVSVTGFNLGGSDAVGPGDTITMYLADPSNGQFVPVKMTAPSAAQIQLAESPAWGDPYPIVNKTAAVTGMVADANNCAVADQTVNLRAAPDAKVPAQEVSGDDGTFEAGLTAPVAATYKVTATLQSNPSVTGSVDVPVHPELYTVVPSVGVVAGGQQVTLSGDGFANPSGTAAFFNSTTSQVQTDALKSIQAVSPPSPLGGFGDGIVGVSANSLLTLNSNLVSYTYVVPGRPYFNFYDSGCQGKQLQMVITVYDDNGQPVTVPIELTAHKSLMLLNNFWVPSGQTNSSPTTWITATIQPGTSFTAENLSPHRPLRRGGQGDPYINTASPAPGIMGCVPVRLLLPKELQQFLPNGGDLPPQQMMSARTPERAAREVSQQAVSWSNNANAAKATAYVLGPPGSENAIHVRTIGWEKFRTLMQPPMYLKSSGPLVGAASGTGTVPVRNVQFSGPIFSISAAGRTEEDVSPLGRELHLSFGTPGRGGAQTFRIVHLTKPAGQPTWIEDAPEQSDSQGLDVTRTVNQSGLYALVEIVGTGTRPAPPQTTPPPLQQPQPSTQPTRSQPAPANSTVLVPSNGFQGGVLTGMVIGPDDQPVPNTPVQIAGGLPVTLTGEVVSDQPSSCPPGDTSCQNNQPQPPPSGQVAKSSPPLINCAKMQTQSGRAANPSPLPPAGVPDPASAGPTAPTTSPGQILTDAAGRFALCVAPNVPTVAVTLPGGAKATVNALANQLSSLPSQPPTFFQPGQVITVAGSMGNIVGTQNNNSWLLHTVGAWSPNGQQSLTTFQAPQQAQPGNLDLSYTGSDGRSHQLQASVFKILRAYLDRSQLHSNQGATFDYEVQFRAQAGRSLCVEMHSAGPVVIVQPPAEVIPVDSAGLGRFSGKIRATQVVPGSTVPFELTPNIHVCGQH